MSEGMAGPSGATQELPVGVEDSEKVTLDAELVKQLIEKLQQDAETAALRHERELNEQLRRQLESSERQHEDYVRLTEAYVRLAERFLEMRGEERREASREIGEEAIEAAVVTGVVDAEEFSAEGTDEVLALPSAEMSSKTREAMTHGLLYDTSEEFRRANGITSAEDLNAMSVLAFRDLFDKFIAEEYEQQGKPVDEEKVGDDDADVEKDDEGGDEEEEEGLPENNGEEEGDDKEEDDDEKERERTLEDLREHLMRELFGSDEGWAFAEERRLRPEDIKNMDEDELWALYQEWKAGKLRREIFDTDDGRAFAERMGLKPEDIARMNEEELLELYNEWEAEKSKRPKEGPEDLTLSVVENTEDERVMAEDAAERMLREDLATGNILTKFAKGIWKGQMFKGYYLKKYEQQAFGRGRRERGLDLSDDEQALIDRSLSQYDEVREKMNTRELPPDHPATQAAKAAIEAFARGSMDEDSFKDEIGRIEAMLRDNGDEHAEGCDIVFGNYMKIVEAVRGRLAHDSGVENVMEGFRMMHSEADKSLKSEAHRDALDKITNWLERKTNGVVPSALLAGGVSMAAWLGNTAASSIGRLGGFLGGVAVSGTVAAVRERNRVTGDRAQMLRDMEMGREIGSTKYDQEMSETMYEMASATDLTSSLNEAMDSGDENAIMAALANIRMLDQMSSREAGTIPLISFSSEDTRRQERLGLDVAMAEAKVRLREMMGLDENTDMNAHLDEGIAVLEEAGGWDQEAADIDAKDAAFRKLRGKRTRKAFATTALTMTAMAAIPFVIQETQAAFSPDSYGLADHAFKLENNADASLTAAAEWLGLKNPNATEWVTPAVAQYDRLLSAEEKAALEEKGFSVSESSTKNVKLETSETTDMIELNAREYGEQYGTRVTRIGHANNGTTISDGNELRAYYTGNSESGFGIVTGMTDAGSMMPNGEVIPFSSLAQNGDIKAFISLTGDTQSTPIEIIGRLTSNGQLEFIPEPGSLAAQCFDESGKFIGKYFEVAVDRGLDAAGRTQIIPLATAVGGGLGNGTVFTDEVTRSVTNKVYETVSKTTVAGFEREIESVASKIPGFIPIPIFRRRNLTNGPERTEGGPEGPTPPPENPPRTGVRGPELPPDNPPPGGGLVPIADNPPPGGGGGGEIRSGNPPPDVPPDGGGGGGQELVPVGRPEEPTGGQMVPVRRGIPRPVPRGGSTALVPAGGSPETSRELVDLGGESTTEVGLNERLMRDYGGLGRRLLAGEMDDLGQDALDDVLDAWWGGLSDAARSRLDGRSQIELLMPDSLKVRDWLRRRAEAAAGEQSGGGGGAMIEAEVVGEEPMVEVVEEEMHEAPRRASDRRRQDALRNQQNALRNQQDVFRNQQGARVR